MQNLLFFLWMVASFQINASVMNIQEIDSFNQVQAIDCANHKTLMLFDVDETLIVPESKMLWADVFESDPWVCQTLLNTYKNSSRSVDYLQSIWQKDETPRLIEPEIVSKIKMMQKKDVKVFGLTALSTGSHETIASLTDWRVEKLKTLGI